MGDRPAAARGVLILAYWYPPVNESGAHRPHRFSRYLPQFGYRPFVVSAPASVPAEVDVFRPTGEPGSSKIRSLLRDFILRIAPYNDRLEWVPQATRIAGTLADRTSALISTSPPVAAHIVALYLQWRHKLVWIADFRDPIVGNPFRTRWLGRIYDRVLERMVVSRADAVVLNTDAALKSFIERYPRFRAKCHVIWNGYDPQDKLAPAPVPVRSHKVIAHLGSIYGGRHPGRLLDSLARCIRKGQLDGSRFRIRLVGSIDNREGWLGSEASTSLIGAGTLEYNGKTVPRDEARKEMAEADGLLLLDLNELATGLQVPAKIFEYIRIGRPILALTAKGSPVERILRQSGIPYVCIYVDDADEEFDRKALSYLSLSSVAQSPSEWFHQQFDAVAQTQYLASLLDSALAGADQQQQTTAPGCAVDEAGMQ